MNQWKGTADAANSVSTVAYQYNQGSGHAARASNNTALFTNTTPGAFTHEGAAESMVIGQFPVTSWAKANTSGESAKVHGSGWAIRKAWEGPILTLTAANGQFANGETVTISGGTVNAVANLTTNATGNLVSAAVVTNGLFPNTSGATVAFTREKHVANLNFSNSTVLTGVGNANVINVSIGNTQLSYGVVAVGSFTSNSTGGITNTQTQAITWAGANVGLFANNQANASVTVTFTNANGTVVGGTFVATANLVTSSGGAVAIGSLGGRGGRVQYELLVSMAHNSLANGAGSNTTQLPQ